MNHLLQFGIIPLIVVEGVPPDLKQDTMRNRLGSVNGGKVKRSRFNALHREVSLSLSLDVIDLCKLQLPFSVVKCWNAWDSHTYKLLEKQRQCVLT